MYDISVCFDKNDDLLSDSNMFDTWPSLTLHASSHSNHQEKSLSFQETALIFLDLKLTFPAFLWWPPTGEEYLIVV